MNTTTTPKKIKCCTTQQELDDLTKKVKASNTYKNSWFVYAEKVDTTTISEERPRLFIVAHQRTYIDANQLQHGCTRTQLTRQEPREQQYNYHIGNLFTHYWIYKQATDMRWPRAQEWENIKRASAAYIKRHAQDTATAQA